MDIAIESQGKHLPLKNYLVSIFAVVACLSFFTVLIPVTASASGLPVTGNVWLDLNADGKKVAPGFIDDAGFAGVQVKAFDSSGNSSSTNSLSNGNYSIDVTALDSGPFRVEVIVPFGYTSAPLGSATDSTVKQSVASGSTGIDFAIHDPSSYCSSNPRLFVSCFSSGNGQIAGSNPTAATSTKASSKSFRFDDSKYPGHPDYVAPIEKTTQAQTGSIYGLGFSRATGYIYQGAFLRRHTGFGPGGTGAIYEVNPNTGATVRTLNIPSAGTAPAGRGLSGDIYNQSRDINAYSAAGKTSLGDVDVVGDGKTLFVSNLNTRELARVDGLDTVTPTYSSYALPPSVTCPGGVNDRRIFGLGSKVVSGFTKLYVGVTCTGQTNNLASDLQGQVVEFDVASNTWGSTILTLPLNYPKGCALRNSATGNLGCAWKAWNDNFYTVSTYQVLNQWFIADPQPVISDIQFDQTGAMVLGIADRSGWQFGFENLPPTAPGLTYWFGQWVEDPGSRWNQKHTAFAAGDQIRACNVSGSFVLENNGTCGGTTTSGAGNNQGPGNGEFYWGDSITRTELGVTIGHEELSLGALAFVPGRTSMAATITDPFFTLDGVYDFRSNSVGIGKLAHATDSSIGATAGGWFNALEIGIQGGGTNPFAKAGGLGDLEVLCESAPLEIGNFVWFDANENGIQDPAEPPLENVGVSLVDLTTNTTVATAKTSAQGKYVFASEGTGNVVSNGWDGSNSGDDNPNDQYGIVADPNSDLSDSIYGIFNNRNYRIIFDRSTTNITNALTTFGVPNATALMPTSYANDPNLGGTQRDNDAIRNLNVDYIDLTTGTAGQNNHTLDAGFQIDPASTTTTSTSTTSTSTTSPIVTTTQPIPTSTTTTSTTLPPSILGDVVGRSLDALPFTGAQTQALFVVAILFLGIGIAIVSSSKKKVKPPKSSV